MVTTGGGCEQHLKQHRKDDQGHPFRKEIQASGVLYLCVWAVTGSARTAGVPCDGLFLDLGDDLPGMK